MNLDHAFIVLKDLPYLVKTYLPNIYIDESATLNCLFNFSKFYLAAHFPMQIRNSKQKIKQSLDQKVICEILQQSIKYIEGSEDNNRDIKTIVSYAMEVLTERDPYALLEKLNVKVKYC